MKRLLALAAVLALGAACGDDGPPSAPTTTSTSPSSTTATTTTTTTGAPAEACSAGGLERPAAQQGLPVAVADLRDEILDAALACDLDRLAELAAEGEGPFTYSFGGPAPGGFAGHLRSLEASGEDVVALLVRTLALPHTRSDDLVIWPSAHREAPGHEDWEAVRPLYGDEAVDRMIAGGTGFLGYRVGIGTDGDWQYFVAGD